MAIQVLLTACTHGIGLRTCVRVTARCMVVKFAFVQYVHGSVYVTWQVCRSLLCNFHNCTARLPPRHSTLACLFHHKFQELGPESSSKNTILLPAIFIFVFEEIFPPARAIICRSPTVLKTVPQPESCSWGGEEFKVFFQCFVH